MKLHVRTIWISDTHLGSKGARAEELARFLKHVRCDQLYLVGDIIDCWRLRSRWYWPAAHNDVIRRILKHASRGTEVVYVPGNHDDAARQFVNMSFGGVAIKPHTTHTTADGKKLFVTHGDQYDLVVQHSRLLALLGSVAYETLLKLNRYYNTGRRAMGLPYASLSQAIKLKVKRACTFISNFETILAEQAQKRGMDGVVCGHIHKAEQREMPGSIQYLNCGDWVESCSALVEHYDGTLEIIDGIETVNSLKNKRNTLAGAKNNAPAHELGDLDADFDPELDADLDMDPDLDIERMMPHLVPDDRALFGTFRPIFLDPPEPTKPGDS